MPIAIGMLLYPGLTQLDLTGPLEFLHRLPGSRIHLLWKTKDPIVADSDIGLVPNTTFGECPTLDVLFVGGGAGQVDLMTDIEVLDFLRAQGAQARYVTSVCTGALLLGAAGLLEGYRAATHWAFMDLLPTFGATPVHERVVVDRNRITGGGVTAGIDFALELISHIAGEPTAEAIQLALEYDPAPRLRSGHPRLAKPEVLAQVRGAFAARYGV